MKLGEDNKPTNDRLRGDAWQDKYCWPDPDEGWSGALAGYPPDHKIRGGRLIPLHLVARRYLNDPRVLGYRKFFSGWGTSEFSVPVTSIAPEKEVVVVPEDSPRKTGRPPKGERPMGSTERSRLSRARKKGGL